MNARKLYLRHTCTTALLVCAGLSQSADAAVSTSVDTKGNVVIRVTDQRGIGGWYVYEGTEATGQFEKQGQHDCKKSLTVTLTGITKYKGGKQESKHGNHEHYVAYTACRPDDDGELFVETTLDPATGLVQSGLTSSQIKIRVLDPDGVASVTLIRGNDDSGTDETKGVPQPENCPPMHEITLSDSHVKHAHYVEYQDCRKKSDTEGWNVAAGGGVKIAGGNWTNGKPLFYEPGSDADSDDFRSDFRIADMNGDQLNDVVVTGQSGFAVFYNQGNGIMGNRQYYELGFPEGVSVDPAGDDPTPVFEPALNPVIVPTKRLDTDLVSMTIFFNGHLGLGGHVSRGFEWDPHQGS